MKQNQVVLQENRGVLTLRNVSKYGVGATIGGAMASSAFAAGEGGFGSTASAAVEGSKSDITTVGIAVIGVVCLIFGIKVVKRLIGG
ncbi:TPA: hypothetical protein NU789_003190 [Acinetobacter baumannii]|uniref:hypothetical protein n=1 Tax=Acinetobacter baumannii TaxID=470 RepID=UPI000B545796|nr:hypothetical protein [Acinetobacter baumannii]MDA4921857.1 hypothetical protein [Acinetobacter baumannii]MDT1779764.1 hypothetical protein [Acinetobacter baumannii]OWX20126.1 hypothetical protein A7A33_05255 [Acinetobacter baumannii]PRO08520.1 hypothetical protein B9W31_19880 [Acinetobacter baumannii]PRO26450.1 hypothetical protein B9W57_09725 [Acinetobacter baumannii]